MKKILVLAAVVLASGASFAQDLDAAMDRATKKTEQMTASLALTPEQVERVRILNEGVEQKNEYINADATISAEEKKNRIQMNEDARNQTFQQLFTEEQYNKYKMERMKTAPQRTEQRVAPANTRSKVENK